MLRDVLAIAIGRLTRRAVLLVRPGGGTAIPGRVVERLSPGLLARILRQPRLIVVTGSNGKGTTTKMLAAILQAHGVDLFTNKRAGNITRGMLSDLITVVDWRGRFRHEVAVMEMDEGYAALTLEQAPAEVTVLLNVMLDQLHRWGSPDVAAGYLDRAARATTGTLVVNREDPHLRGIVAGLAHRSLSALRLAALAQDPRSESKGATPEIRTFGVTDAVLATLPHGLGSAPAFGIDAPRRTDPGTTQVTAYEGDRASIELGADGPHAGAVLAVRLPSKGIHLAVDSAAAIEAARVVLGTAFDPAKTIVALDESTSMWARGEQTRVRGKLVEFHLAKSPPSTQVNLDDLEPGLDQVMVIAGKDIPDPALLWPVDWSRVERVRVLGGLQAYEMAMKFAYEGIEVDEIVEDVEDAVDAFFALPDPEHGVKTVFFSADGMRRARRHLGLYDADTERAAS
ncbi:MAG TPA: Mur ligase family protein [Microbacteriaceae bacterium]|nr:Mur ligase family protein [Microbacteriaceae bacterium]